MKKASKAKKRKIVAQTFPPAKQVATIAARRQIAAALDMPSFLGIYRMDIVTIRNADPRLWTVWQIRRHEGAVVFDLIEIVEPGERSRNGRAVDDPEKCTVDPYDGKFNIRKIMQPEVIRGKNKST